MSLPPDLPDPGDDGPRLGAVDEAQLPVLEDRVTVDGAAARETPAAQGPEAAVRAAVDAALEALRERLVRELLPLVGGRDAGQTREKDE